MFTKIKNDIRERGGGGPNGWSKGWSNVSHFDNTCTCIIYYYIYMYFIGGSRGGIMGVATPPHPFQISK